MTTHDTRMDPIRVTAAVRIRISLDRLRRKQKRLEQDLTRLRNGMTNEEHNEYLKRLT